MTQTISIAGTPLYFPTSLATGVDGVIVPMSPESFVELASRVAPDGALLFAKRLIGAARKYHRELRYAAINRQRVQLAKLCLDRALGDAPDIVTELRAARETIAAERDAFVDTGGGRDRLDPYAVPFVERLDRQLARIDAALSSTS
ncbi:hypothetical protein EV283_1043 [Sphingomonas sp. BK036]|uniref:hypothetical protein n=1 Tax=Sphingomonas sp. BK036 TaxID=2512122 RepID=UPI00102967D7|nr:hypothetical protein [Sphingomonas sp. BK036]RZT56986.1 hypothetical protein EV283_1043 [Sphingomonas sp. BK036]